MNQKKPIRIAIKAVCAQQQRAEFQWLSVRSKGKAAQFLIGVMFLAACRSRDDLTWTEEVKLPDERVLMLTRWAEFKGGSSHVGDPSTESSQSFEFRHPETGEIVKWHNTLSQGRLRTIALWLDKGKPLLLTNPAYGGDFRKYNCPNPPYLLYEYSAGEWHSKPLSKIPITRIRSNLTTSPLWKRREIEQSKRRLTAEQTSASYTHFNGIHATPYIIQFDGMPEQTFNHEDCSRVSNLKNLIFVEEK